MQRRVQLRGDIALVRFLVLYTFHRVDALSLHRLMRLARMNPNVTVVPALGIGFKKPPLKTLIYRSSGYSTLLNIVCEKIERIRRKAEIDALKDYLEKRGFLLHCDSTTLGMDNQDLAIVNWFLSQGEKYDFDFLIYFEYDMFTTKTIESLYEAYSKFDAGFVDYREASPFWDNYDRPRGARRSVVQWLKHQGSLPITYAGFFPGNMISRKALACLSKLDFPIGYCEMRLPSILTGLGFSCTNLDFPMVKWTFNKNEAFSKNDVEKRPDYGIFHPVYDDFEA